MMLRALALTDLKALLLIECLAWPADAADDQAARYYLDRGYWITMDWGRVETSKLWRTDGWVPFEGEQYESTTFLKQRTVTILGQDLSATWGYRNNKQENRFFTALHSSRNLTRGACEDIAKRTAAKLGHPVKDDGTFALPISKDSYFLMISSDYQWDLGETRIYAACDGSGTKGGGGEHDTNDFTWSMKFAHVSDTPKLVPKFALTCVRSLNFTTQPNPQPLADMVILIDLFRGRVLTSDLVPLADEKSLHASEGEIRFSVSTQTVSTDYVISRVTGALSASVKQSGQPAASISGRCEKTDTMVRKF
jgi:hypothetical protein